MSDLVEKVARALVSRDSTAKGQADMVWHVHAEDAKAAIATVLRELVLKRESYEQKFTEPYQRVDNVNWLRAFAAEHSIKLPDAQSPPPSARSQRLRGLKNEKPQTHRRIHGVSTLS